VEFQEGAPFEQRRLRQLHNDLVRGDYFSGVDVRAQPHKEDKVADVLLTLEEGRRVRYGVGVGFGTDTGVVVRADLVQRRMNRHGHRLELDTELSKVRQNATIDYRMPGKRPQNDWYSLYGGLNREDSDAIESIAWKMGVRENRFHTLNWSSTPFAEFVVERFYQDGDWSQKTSLVPGWGVNFVTANAPARPTQGLRLRGEVAGAAKQVLSDASFIRVYLNGKTILPFSKRGRLLIRGEAGWMTTDDFDKVPPTWRFFAGGDRSVRGYDYQSLGPLDDEGKAIGGRNLLSGSIEGDWRILERWSAAVFADAGNVGEEDLLRNMPWSVGAGVRWYSPVGPIRLDLAFPQNGSSDFRVHISMGPDL
jgi:translocation and assembly module TamA